MPDLREHGRIGGMAVTVDLSGVRTPEQFMAALRDYRLACAAAGPAGG